MGTGKFRDTCRTPVCSKVFYWACIKKSVGPHRPLLSPLKTIILINNNDINDKDDDDDDDDKKLSYRLETGRQQCISL